MHKWPALILALLIWNTWIPVLQAAPLARWRPVRKGIQFGISGIALVERQGKTCTFLVAHDNKGGVEQGRLALVKVLGDERPLHYLPLRWPTDTPLPIDLEALSRVPGAESLGFMAITSRGQVYHLRLGVNHRQVSVLQTFNLPDHPVGSNFEAFSLQDLDGQLLTVWADRGEAARPAVIYWGVLNLDRGVIEPQGSTKLAVPWPMGNVRHISDLKIDPKGRLYITATTDDGDDGPFESAAYVAGSFEAQSDALLSSDVRLDKINSRRFIWRRSPLMLPIDLFDNHKVEALELLSEGGDRMVVGTDDENYGSALAGQCHFP